MSPSIEKQLALICEKLVSLETEQKEFRKTVEETLETCKNANAQCLKMLAACREGYCRIAKCSEYLLEKQEEMIENTEDMTNSISNIGWG